MSNSEAVVYLDDGLEPGWYFWDESWSSCYGPYPTREVATNKMAEYAKEVLGD